MQYHLDCATLVLNAKKISTYVEHKQNIGAFSTHVEWSETQFFFVAHICLHIASCSSCSLHIWFLRAEMLYRINSAIFTSLLDTHMFYLRSTFHSLISKEIPRRRGTVDCASVPFLVRLWSAGYSREVIGIGRDDWFIGCWCCWWNTLAFFLQLKWGSGPPGEPWPSGTGAPPGLRHRQRTRSTPGASLGSHTLRAHRGSATRPLPLRASGMLCANRVARNGGHICCPQLRKCFIISSDFTYTTQVQRWIRFSRKESKSRSCAHKADFFL